MIGASEKESTTPTRAKGTALQRSIRSKILALVLGTTATALLLAGIAMLAHDVLVYRQSWVADMNTEAAILARSIAPALAFDDRPTTQRNLSALQAREAISSVVVYDSAGALYAQYQRPGAAAPPTRMTADSGVRIDGNRLELSQRIVQNGEFLGVIYISARYDLQNRVRAYVTIFALVTLASLVAAMILSNVLQRVITTPLEAMAETAGDVVANRDYSRRAEQTTDDEIGVVVHAFNKMLDEVQGRTRELEESNSALKQEVRIREEAEEALRTSERLYRAIGESIDFGVWICDANGRNTYASDSFLKLTGLTQEQCSNEGWGDALHPDDALATIAAWQECVRSQSTHWYREHRVRGVDGVYHPILARGVRVRMDGETWGWAGINLDISQIKQTEEALREADRRKDEFVATLAHELRNPLAPIRHAAKILDTAAADDSQRQWARDIIARQVQHMSLLLDDLLDVSRITRGRLELKKDHVTLESLVTSAVETARPLFESRHHVLEVRLPQEPLHLEVDPLRLSQALSNLLTNAAKYTDPGGRITIAVAIADDIVVTVQDTGIGIHPSGLGQIFEMFSQVESAVDRSQGGLGIGLALVKGLVTLHGGTVEAISRGVGQGSAFTIRLPRTLIVKDRRVTEDLEDAKRQGLHRCRVLIADDNVDGARSLAVLLEVQGYAIAIAHSGAEALRVGAREHPEVCILDIGMPELNGYETARRIRREAWGKRALLIAITGWGQKDDKERARAAGFDHHFTKPVDLDSLERLLADFGSLKSAEVVKS
jgi:PAS domain S-box-containing protein